MDHENVSPPQAPGPMSPDIPAKELTISSDGGELIPKFEKLRKSIESVASKHDADDVL